MLPAPARRNGPAPETYAAAKNDAATAETPAEPPEEESDGKPDIEIEIVDGDEETDEDDDEPETAGLEDLRHKRRRAEYALPVLFQEETLCLNMRAAYSVRLPRRTA